MNTDGTTNIASSPEEEWLLAIGSALMGHTVGVHHDGVPIEGESKKALSIIFGTAQKMPDHLMRTLGDILFSEQGTLMLPEHCRPAKSEELILFTIRLAALFGRAGNSEDHS